MEEVKWFIEEKYMLYKYESEKNMYEFKVMFDDVFFERDEFMVVLRIVGKDFDLIELVILKWRDFICYLEDKY